MRIDVKQIISEGQNIFEVEYDGKLQYKAKLPFITISDPMNLEKIRSIKIYDPNENEVYQTDYKYIDNLKEEIIPLKYLVTGSQKFNQLLFISENNTIKIYYEENEIWKNRYVIEINDKKYYCYSIEDGYIRHFPIYDEEKQIGEALKSNVVINGKDEYCCYLKEGYEFLSDGITALLLYLDRSEYSSSYLVNKSYNMEKSFSYNKTNKYYDKEWVKNNFDDEFYKKVDADVLIVKERVAHPWKNMSEKEKKLIKYILIFSLICSIIFFTFIFVLLKKFG